MTRTKRTLLIHSLINRMIKKGIIGTQKCRYHAPSNVKTRGYFCSVRAALSLRMEDVWWEHFIGRLENESKSVLYKGKSVQEWNISLHLPVRWIMNQAVLTLLCAVLFGVSLVHSAGKLNIYWLLLLASNQPFT